MDLEMDNYFIVGYMLHSPKTGGLVQPGEGLFWGWIRRCTSGEVAFNLEPKGQTEVCQVKKGKSKCQKGFKLSRESFLSSEMCLRMFGSSKI